jgi:hypothetical protein
MAEAREHEFDPQLLDLHLGHLDAGAQAELRQRLAQDAALSAQNEALASVFQALNTAARPEPPEDLAARVCARVAASGPAPRIVRPPDELTAELERRTERVIRLGNLRDIVAVAAMVVLAIGVGVPGMMHMRERQDRMGCSWNLAQIGQGMQQYVASSLGSFPFVGWSHNASWQPTSDPNLTNIPNRRHLYPLLRYAYVREPRVFVCPAQGDVPMPKEAIGQVNDFVEARNLSYAYQNMAGVRPNAQDDPRLPVLADENPLFDSGRPVFDARRLLQGDSVRRNSPAHRGAGQNLLALDGRVRWVTEPLAGVRGDNIWVLHGVLEYTGREGPQSASDSHLLK